MVAEDHDDTRKQVRDVINRLQSPVPNLPTLLALISSLLDCIGLLPPHYVRYNTAPLHSAAFNIPRHLPPLQRALLEHVIPAWEPDLSREKLMPLVEQWFIPDTFSFATPAAGEVTVHAYRSILSLSFTPYSMDLLTRLTKAYPVDRLHTSVFSHLNKDSSSRQTTLAWEDVVKSILSVPARVANSLEGKGEPPKGLEQGPYFADLCVRCEALLCKLSQERTEGASCLGCRELISDNLQKVCYLLPTCLRNSRMLVHSLHPNPPLRRNHRFFCPPYLP
jgi:telomere length regulation protein